MKALLKKIEKELAHLEQKSMKSAETFLSEKEAIEACILSVAYHYISKMDNVAYSEEKNEKTITHKMI